jgi:hypothetical protein
MVIDKSNIVSQFVVPFAMFQPALHLGLNNTQAKRSYEYPWKKLVVFMPIVDFSPTSRNLQDVSW